MPEVKITHKGLTSDDTKTPPKREPVPVGTYIALIMAAPMGVTKATPPLNKLSIEFQVLYRDEDHNEEQQGRRVFQDYILENDAKAPDLSKQRAYELRMLLDATQCPYTDEGFNSDHLLSKTVKITVRHRTGKADPADPKAELPIFSNVSKVDTAEAIAEGDLV